MTAAAKEAIVLAGGFGTRLKPVVSDLPKPMAPVKDVPFLEYLLEYLVGYGFDHAVLSVGYRREAIESHFGQRYKTIRISYAMEETPLGTGGAVRFALESTQSEQVFVINGDTFFDVDLDAMYKSHLEHQPDVTMAIKQVSPAYRYGTVQLSGNRIVSFIEKGKLEKGYINGGIYMLQRGVFNQFHLPAKFSLESEFFSKQPDKLKILPYISEGYFIDIGIPEDYHLAQNEIPKRIHL